MKSLLLFPLLFATLGSASEESALVSIYAIDASTKKVLFEQGADKSLIPASCMKIIATGAALHLLGPEMRFQTDLEADGTLDEEGTLHGNLILRGGGDPCLGSDRIKGSLSWKEQIEAWVAAVAKFGVKRIEGTVIGDGATWEKAMAVPSWNWEDIGNYYGAGASALSFHENSYTLVFKPGKKEGDPAVILRLDPPLPTLTLLNEVKTGPAGSGDRACIYGAEFTPFQSVRGTIPAGVEEFAIKGAIPDPAGCCADLLAKSLESKGILILRRSMAPQERAVIHTTYSPPVREIVYWTNQNSVNLYAEHLLKKMGEIVYSEGSTSAGIKAVTGFWRSQGIDLDGFHMADASGLSRQNCASAKQMVAILLKMKESEFFSLFLRSLPDLGDRCKAKSGNMSRIHGAVGFLDDAVFAILVNQSTDPKIKEKIRLLLSQKNGKPLPGSIMQ